MEYIVYLEGGSVGNNKKLDKKGRNIYKSFLNLKEAKDYAKRMNKQLSPGEKKYYKMKFKAAKN